MPPLVEFRSALPEEIASIERRMIWVQDWDALLAVEDGTRTMPGRTTKVVVEL